MSDIWIVTSGSYSDYAVHCAFETMEAADAYAEAMKMNEDDQHYRVERIDLNPPLPEDVKEARESPRSVRSDRTMEQQTEEKVRERRKAYKRSFEAQAERDGRLHSTKRMKR